MTVDLRKQRKIIRTAAMFLAWNEKLRRCHCALTSSAIDAGRNGETSIELDSRRLPAGPSTLGVCGCAYLTTLRCGRCAAAFRRRSSALPVRSLFSIVREDHALTGLARVESEHRFHRHPDIKRHARKTRPKTDASLVSFRLCAAVSLILRMILPSLTCSRGTLTPSTAASTTMCGVWPLSPIHSCMARIRYGLFERLGLVNLLLSRLIIVVTSAKLTHSLRIGMAVR